MLYELVETRFSNLSPRAQLFARAFGWLVSILPNERLRRFAAARIFRSAYDLFGGRAKYLITGMAPIKLSTINLFKLMQLPLFEVYGLLEFGMVAANTPMGNKPGSVGKPLPGVKMKILPDGELVLSRGQSLASGYFECADGESERTFVGDGAVATGDIGYLDADGYLFLRGRKKELIVTRGGKKIYPEAIEAKINACSHVARSVIISEPGRDDLLAIIVPKTGADSLAKRGTEKFVMALNDAGLTPNVGRVVFFDDGFSKENGFLRPNLKLDRGAIARHFGGKL